jgi:hypothetical protein
MRLTKHPRNEAVPKQFDHWCKTYGFKKHGPSYCRGRVHKNCTSTGSYLHVSDASYLLIYKGELRLYDIVTDKYCSTIVPTTYADFVRLVQRLTDKLNILTGENVCK